MSKPFLVVDKDSLAEAIARASRADRIITAFRDDEPHPTLGFSVATGKWFESIWFLTQPCGVWTVGADGKPSCRVTTEA